MTDGAPKKLLCREEVGKRAGLARHYSGVASINPVQFRAPRYGTGGGRMRSSYLEKSRVPRYGGVGQVIERAGIHQPACGFNSRPVPHSLEPVRGRR